jgi:hypothetical protein
MRSDETAGGKDFPEWMVTQALASYLGVRRNENSTRMAWLFGLEVETPNGNYEVKRLCGFDWAKDEVSGGAEESFKEGKDDNGDRGNILVDDFRKIYLTITPDFRYWPNRREKQLIIEAKDTLKPTGQRDRVQAQRYFSYFRDSGWHGAVFYFVPNPKSWLTWLSGIAGGSVIPFGVVDLKAKIVPEVANELVHVVGKTLVQTADLLESALRFSKNRM